MGSTDAETFLIDFHTYRTAGTKDDIRAEEERGEAIFALLEQLNLFDSRSDVLIESMTAIGFARFLGALPEGTIVTSDRDGMVHMRLQRHKVAEAYKILDEVAAEGPALEELMTIRRGLEILFSVVANATGQQEKPCTCEICTIGRQKCSQ